MSMTNMWVGWCKFHPSTINGGDNTLAKKLYYQLATQSGKLSVRFRGNELGCTGCLRITVGTHDENTQLIDNFKKTLYKLANNN